MCEQASGSNLVLNSGECQGEQLLVAQKDAESYPNDQAMRRIHRSSRNAKVLKVSAADGGYQGNRMRVSTRSSAIIGGEPFALRAVAISLLMVSGPHVYALPNGGAVAAGGVD